MSDTLTIALDGYKTNQLAETGSVFDVVAESWKKREGAAGLVAFFGGRGADEDYLMAAAIPVWYAEQFLPTKTDSFGPMPSGRSAADLW